MFCLFVLDWGAASAAQTASVSRTRRENDGRETDDNSQQPDNAHRCHRRNTDKGEQKAPQSRRGMQPQAQHLLNHSSPLHCPVVCQVEPRLHAHGRTVRHHSAGSTDTSGRQSSEKAQTQHLRIKTRL
ncbi:hypothetical protein M3J09_009713 [Ascochyta lentis]